MTTATHDRLLQLVSFRLGDEEFAVDVGQVQEIVRLTTITAVPRSPGYVEGVVNLRGRIVPVIGLAKRFGLPPHAPSKGTRIIITEVAGRTVGMLVDAVSEVLRLASAAIDPATEVLQGGVSNAYITGIGKLEGRLLIMLDLERLLTRDEAGSVASAAETAEA
jgi:purine-binding chemotaxis protein CheW